MIGVETAWTGYEYSMVEVFAEAFTDSAPKLPVLGAQARQANTEIEGKWQSVNSKIIDQLHSARKERRATVGVGTDMQLPTVQVEERPATTNAASKNESAQVPTTNYTCLGQIFDARSLELF